jgi:hypothetical protein
MASKKGIIIEAIETVSLKREVYNGRKRQAKNKHFYPRGCGRRTVNAKQNKE